MMKERPEEPQVNAIASDNVVPFPKKTDAEMDEENYRILSTLLVNEFGKFKGRPLL